jgi:HAD superfamily hydrolase (TIGR01490 family)
MTIAFFDIDGTLVAEPSLEERFFFSLLRRGKIPAANFLRWPAKVLSLVGANPAARAQSARFYLEGLPSAVLLEWSSGPARLIGEPSRAGIERLFWHAARGDEIVLASGTLAPLARAVKAALERELLFRGLDSDIAVIATELAKRDGVWTGAIEGEPIEGEAKAAAIKKFAARRAASLSQCFAYGNHWLDLAMLEAVGNPFVVNPKRGLQRKARERSWPVLDWPPYCGRSRAALRASKQEG